MIVHVKAYYLRLPNDTSVLFEAGIDHLEYFEVGARFFVEVQVVEREGDLMVVQPRGIAPVDT